MTGIGGPELILMLLFSVVPLLLGAVVLYWVIRLGTRDGYRDALRRDPRGPA